MAFSRTISRKELERVAAEAYEGFNYRICLAGAGATGYNQESLTSEWDSVELSGNGYARVTGTINTGAYDTSDGRYEFGPVAGANQVIEAIFTASGGALIYDRLYVVINNNTYVHSVGVESPSVTLNDGQSKTYRIQLGISAQP